MKKFFPAVILIVCLLFVALAGCKPDSSEGTTSTPDETTQSENKDEETHMVTDTIFLTIGSHKINVILEQTAAVHALLELLETGDITYTACDYGGFEKVGALGHTLPREDRQMTTEAGDVILYSGNQIVLFYGSNSWSYTRLGKMQGYSAEELKAILKEADPVTVTISLK